MNFDKHQFSLIIFYGFLIQFMSTKDHVKLVNRDKQKFRLHYHIMPPFGWMNDPNGLSYFKGEYHVFFQHNPFETNPGNVHWGHVKSVDLVHWQYLPNALAPDHPYDKDGCYSGSAIEENNNLLLFYTGNVDESNFTVFSTQNQNMAISVDGGNFKKNSENPIIPFPPEDGGEAFRDPKVWKYGEKWYQVLGNQVKNNGRVVLYESSDLDTWEYKGVLAFSNGTLGYMWECPDFFMLNGSYILIFSPQGIDRNGDDFANLYQTGFLAGNYSYEENRFDYKDFKEIDRGHDFYAMQTMETPDKRRIAIAWMDMWESDFPEKEEGWAGALTIPRELFFIDGQLIQKPIKEMELLRSKILFAENFKLHGIKEFENVTAAEITINAKICKEIDQYGFALNDKEGLVVQFFLNKSENSFTLDRGDDDPRRIVVDDLGDTFSFHLFIDASSIEIFLNEGKITFTSRIYPKSTPKFLLFSNGNCDVEVDISAVELKDIWRK